MAETPHERLERVMDELFSELAEEIHVEITVASECAWAGQLRWIPFPNSPGPDRSVNVYVTGQASPDDLIRELLSAFLLLDHNALRAEL